MCLECIKIEKENALVRLKECIDGTIRYHGSSDSLAYYREINNISNEMSRLDVQEEALLKEESGVENVESQ